MDAFSWEGMKEAEARSRIACGYVIVFANDRYIQTSTFAHNRKESWDKFCQPDRRKHWKARGARCVPARIVAEYPEP